MQAGSFRETVKFGGNEKNEQIERRMYHWSIRWSHICDQRQCVGRDRTALKNTSITRVLGAEHGIVGVLNDRLFDMGQEDPAELSLLKYTPHLPWVPAAIKWRIPM